MRPSFLRLLLSAFCLCAAFSRQVLSQDAADKTSTLEDVRAKYQKRYDEWGEALETFRGAASKERAEQRISETEAEALQRVWFNRRFPPTESSIEKLPIPAGNTELAQASHQLMEAFKVDAAERSKLSGMLLRLVQSEAKACLKKGETPDSVGTRCFKIRNFYGYVSEHGWDSSEDRSLLYFAERLTGNLYKVLSSEVAKDSEALERTLSYVRGNMRERGGILSEADLAERFAPVQKEFEQKSPQASKGRDTGLVAEKSTKEEATIDVAPIRNELAAVRNLSELRRLLKNFAEPRAQSDLTTLTQQMQTLAAAWESQNLSGIRNARLGAEFKQLQSAAEREVCAHVLRANELLQEPLKEKPVGEAIGLLVNQLDQQREWQRLFHLFGDGVKNRVFSDQAKAEGDRTALRAFLSAQSFERAEQWSEAVNGYQAAQICFAPETMKREAEQRLEALQKDHPNEAGTKEGR